TLVSLYPSTSVYQKQFGALEDYCAEHPKDPAAHFVLAYHLLVRGEQKTAIDALQVVVDNEPKDIVAARLLAALKGDGQPAVATAQAGGPAVEPAAPMPADAADEPSTDLTGSWQAELGGDTYQLSIDQEGAFKWLATPKGSPPVTLEGQYAITGDQLSLDSKSQGVMAGAVKSLGPDKFQFRPVGSPQGDDGLTFIRQQ
ncbi:MAG: hypothetical protein JNG90_11935, partial [Planctomycetaceae bacterium]|nr:hypothetical protein [Planctomycetaceae bacterium]